MRKELFAELVQSMGEALEHASGKRDLRTTVLPAAPARMTAQDVRDLREKLNTSQAVFARFLNVSTQLVQAWEADRRRPEGAALRLLEIGRENPGAVFASASPVAGRVHGRPQRTRAVAKAKRKRASA